MLELENTRLQSCERDKRDLMHQVRVITAQLGQAEVEKQRALEEKRRLEHIIKDINSEVMGIEQRSQRVASARDSEMRQLREQVDGLGLENQRLKLGFEKLKKKFKSYKHEQEMHEVEDERDRIKEKLIVAEKNIEESAKKQKMKNMNAVQAIIAGPPQIKEKVNLKIATPGSKANNLQTST